MKLLELEDLSREELLQIVKNLKARDPFVIRQSDIEKVRQRSLEASADAAYEAYKSVIKESDKAFSRLLVGPPDDPDNNSRFTEISARRRSAYKNFQRQLRRLHAFERGLTKR